MMRIDFNIFIEQLEDRIIVGLPTKQNMRDLHVCHSICLPMELFSSLIRLFSRIMQLWWSISDNKIGQGKDKMIIRIIGRLTLDRLRMNKICRVHRILERYAMYGSPTQHTGPQPSQKSILLTLPHNLFSLRSSGPRTSLSSPSLI